MNKPLKTQTNITDAVEHFTQCVQQAAWNAIPTMMEQSKYIALNMYSKKYKKKEHAGKDGKLQGILMIKQS
jgi:hypothetical protein